MHVPQCRGRDGVPQVFAAAEEGTGLRRFRQGGQVPEARHLLGHVQDSRRGVSTD